MKLKELWLSQNETKGIKVRYLDWNYKIRFFTIKSYDEKRNMFSGSLDTSEDIYISGNTGPWKLYEDEDEFTAKAI